MDTIQLLILDVDGVLTDGKVTYSDAAEELKSFHVRDGSGIKYWMQSGKSLAIITGRSSPTVSRRSQELGIPYLFQGVSNKQAQARQLQNLLQLSKEQTAAIGDDLADLGLFHQAGYRVAVADACEDLIAQADYVTQNKGGCGAVREVIEKILKHQGLWKRILEAEIAPKEG
ncbi:MAG: HAD hydrolase family protein [Gemmataceae bacterium]|nr:HAD hydrolase family protein [Gemmataceae bacterium]